MKKIIIIGATGSTGLYLTEHLSKKNKIFATGYKKRTSNYYKKRGIEYINIDISNKNDFNKLPKEKDNIDALILLAGLMPARMKGYNPYKYIEINTIGTLNTLEYCRKNKINKFIFCQSHSDVAGYWNTGHYIKAEEIRKLKLVGDHAVYIISKCAATDLIEHYHQQYNIQNIIFTTVRLWWK